MLDAINLTEASTGRRITMRVMDIECLEEMEDFIEDYGFHRIGSHEICKKSYYWPEFDEQTQNATLITMNDGNCFTVLHPVSEIENAFLYETGKEADIHMNFALKERFRVILENIRSTKIIPNVTVGFGTDDARILGADFTTVKRSVDQIIDAVLTGLPLDGSEPPQPDSRLSNEVLRVYRNIQVKGYDA